MAPRYRFLSGNKKKKKKKIKKDKPKKTWTKKNVEQGKVEDLL